MQKSVKTLKGTIWNILGSTMYGANSFIMLMMVSRIGTIEQIGVFGIAFTTAQILYIVGLFGANHYQMTDYQEKYQFADYVAVKVLSCLLAIIGCIVAIIFFHFTGLKVLYTITLTFLMMVNAVGELYQSLFFQNNRLDLSGASLFYRTLWSLLAFCGILILFQNILLSICAQIIVNMVVTAYYIGQKASLFISRNSKIVNASSVKALIRECLPLFISTLLMNIIINASKYGIELFLDDTAQGYYNMVFMPVQVINLCCQFLYKPLLNQYALLLIEKRVKEFKKLLYKQMLFLMTLVAVCCLAAYLFGASVLGFLYNKNIYPYRLSLVLVIMGGGVYALCQLLYYILIILRRQIQVMIIYLCTLIITICITALFVNVWGIFGGAGSFICAHFMILIGYCISLYSELGRS